MVVDEAKCNREQNDCFQARESCVLFVLLKVVSEEAFYCCIFLASDQIDNINYGASYHLL